MQALEGIRVVDFSTMVAGPSCTKLLADFGADVIKVEPAGGDPARGVPPFAADEPGLERSLLFLHLNTNKRSVTIDPHNAEGLRLLRELVASAQVVVESGAPGELAGLGLGYTELAASHPGLVYASSWISACWLDLDHVGAEVCEELGATRTSDHGREVDDADALERLHVHPREPRQ